MSLTIPITNISRCSLHDGPGVRTVVYFKGCGLRCQWCHNPETLSAKSHVAYMKSKCIHCGKCVSVCPRNHVIRESDMEFIRSGCTMCGKCTDICPAGALQRVGEKMSTDEIFDEIKKDEHYYVSSGGGVTFSGGECLLYPDAVSEIEEKCINHGFHTAVESALFVPWESIERVIPLTELFFSDLKIAAPEKHRKYTGHDNSLILQNLRRLSETAKNVVIRIPVIPSVNDSDEDIEGFSRIISKLGGALRYVELLKYNYLASSKYSVMGERYTAFSDHAQSDEEMARMCKSISDMSGAECVFS